VQAQEGPIIEIVTPKPNGTVYEKQPEIIVNYSAESGIDVNSIKLIFKGFDVTDWDEITTITSTQLTHKVPEIFALDEGMHNVTVEVSDKNGDKAIVTWSFRVEKPIALKEGEAINVLEIVIYLIIGFVLVSLGLLGYILLLKKTRGFTFEKYFAQHPLQKEYLILYMPVVLGVIFILLGFLYVENTPDLPPFSLEYVAIAGFFIAITPFAIDSLLEKRQILKNERSFAQFLFEMADAMRGGLDPSKAIIELAKTDSGTLGERLKIASDSIRIGRPFDDIITSMGRSFKSDLIRRYSSIIGEASKIGGETATVIFRAAKDMDDFIKVKLDRTRELTMQTSLIYISLAVLVIIIYLLLTIFPSFEGLDISLLTGNTKGLAAATEQAAADTSARVSVLTLKRRFFHVVAVNSIGTGIIIGEFVDGKLKYGLIHSLIMLLATTIFFAIMLF